MHVVNLARGLDAISRDAAPGADPAKGSPAAGSSRRVAFRTTLIAGAVAETEGDMAYYADEHGVAVRYLPAMSRAISLSDDLKTLWALYRLFRRARPAVVHTHTAKAGTLGRLAAIVAGVPVRVHTFHGHVLGGSYFSALKTRVFLEIERQLARGTHRLVVLTEGQARELAEELHVAPRRKFAVVPLGLELAPFAAVDRGARRTTVRTELGIDEDALVVGYVGRLVPVKNHELWLEAMAELVQLVASRGGDHDDASPGSPHVVGLVVGSGEREAELRARARDLGLEAHLRWLGWRRDLPDLYAAMDVLALTSHDEGTPVAVIEALAAGTPVTARDVGGVREVLDAVGAGVAVPRDAGASAWAAALEAAGASPLRPDARATARDLYSVARLSEDIADLYTTLMSD